jgi:hypothetical protein
MYPIPEFHNDPSAPKKTTSETGARDAVKKLYGSQQKFAFLSVTDPLCTQITTNAQSMINQAEKMPSIGSSSQDIYIHTLDSSNLVNKNLEMLKLSNTSYSQEKTTLSLTSNQFNAKLSSAAINSGPFNFSAHSKTGGNFFDSYLHMRRDEIGAEVQVGEVIGGVIKEVVHGFVEEVGNNIARFKEEGFNPSNPKSLFYLEEKKDAPT